MDWNPSWLLGAAGVPGLVGSTILLWRWWIERGDTKTIQTLTREQLMTQAADLRITNAIKVDAELISRLVATATADEIKYQKVVKDKDRGWDTARFWYDKAYEMRYLITPPRPNLPPFESAYPPPPPDKQP